MAGNFYFERDTAFDLITVSGKMIWNEIPIRVRFAVDTGASHSVLDANVLYRRGWISTKPADTQVRTGGGIVEGRVILLPEFHILGKVLKNYSVFSYDFFLTGSAENYDGLLGLDFLENLDFRINMKEKWIQLEL